jgi:flagellar basal-body rod protein FlgF
MDPLTATAASGMLSRSQTLDILANNIANSETAGYKADLESYNLYFGEEAWQGYHEGRAAGAEMPVIEKNWTDFSQGSLTVTGNPTDVALSSNGLFVVKGPNGPLYTRNGQFQISKSGTLETREGYPVLGQTGKPIALDATQPFEITSAGDIRQRGTTIDRLSIADGNSTTCEKAGGGFFKLTTGNTPRPPAAYTVEQGKLEASNVSPASAAVKLVGVMRSFEMLNKAVSMSSEMSRRAVEEVARVNS